MNSNRLDALRREHRNLLERLIAVDVPFGSFSHDDAARLKALDILLEDK